MSESYSVKAMLSAEDRGFTSTFERAAGMTGKINSGLKKYIGIGAAVAIGTKAISAATRTLTSNVGSAVDRYDTMNQFPKVMSNLGIGTKASTKAVDRLSNKLTGLPTTLDSATAGVTNFTSKNGNIKKSTDYFLSLNNAILAGGQPLGIQTTAMEQLSQAYAKGKMDMMEWRSLQTAMPAQLKQVAKAMDMSTDALGEGLRNGSVSMDDFMGTITKLNKKGVKGFASFEKQARSSTGGIKTAFTVMKTSVVRGLADVIGSLDKMLKKNGFPTIGELATKASKKISGAFKRISKAVENIDLKSMAETAAPYWNMLKSILKTVGSVLKTVGGFFADHGSAISKVIPVVLGLVLAYKAFNFIGGIASGVGALTGKLFSMAKGQKTLGKSSTKASKGIGKFRSGMDSLKRSAGIALVIGSLALLALAMKPLASLGTKAIAPLVTFGAVVAGLGFALSKAGPQLQASMKGIVAFAAAVSIMALAMTPLASLGTTAIAPLLTFGAVVAGLAVVFSTFGSKLQASMTGIIVFAAAISVMALAMAPLASTGKEGAIAMGVFGIVIAGLVLVFALFGKSLTGAIPGMLALGVTVLMVGAGMYLAQGAIEALTAFLKQLGNTVVQVVKVIANAVMAIVEVVGGVLCDVMQTAGDVITGIIDSIASGFETLSDGVATVVDAISGGFSSVLDSIAGVIESIGASAKSAGDGFRSVAEGINLISELSIISIGKSLGAVAAGLGLIVLEGGGIPEVAVGVRDLVMGLLLSGAGFASFNSGAQTMIGLSAGLASSISAIKGSFDNFTIKVPNMSGVISALKSIVSSASAIVPKLSAAGQKAGAGLASGLSSGIQRARAAVTTAGTTIVSAARSIGDNCTKGIQSGLAKAPVAASKAVAQVAIKLRSGYGAARSAGSYISQGFASGMESAIGRIRSAASQMVAAADKAIRAKALIKSPSRLTKRLGGYMTTGFALGIASKFKSVTKTSKRLASAAFQSMKKATKSRKYTEIAGRAIDKYKKVMEKKVTSVTKSLEKIINNSAAKPFKGKILKAIQAQGKKAIAATEKSLNALAKKYQKKYDQIKSDQKSYYEKLSDYGSLYTTDSYGLTSFKSFKAETKQVRALEQNMAKLKKTLPYGLMKDIQELDTASGLQYTTELLKKSDAWLKKYGKDYTKYMKTSKNASSRYYKSYITKLDKEYGKALKTESKKLQKRLTTVGSQAMSGLIKGLTSKTSKKSLQKAANSLASILTRTVKKKLKIHSPSKVLMALGKYAIQGFVNGINTMQSKVAGAMENIAVAPVALSPQVAGDFGGTLSDEYEYTRNNQYTIVVPVDLDGREIARATAPHTEAELNKRQARENRRRGKR